MAAKWVPNGSATRLGLAWHTGHSYAINTYFRTLRTLGTSQCAPNTHGNMVMSPFLFGQPQRSRAVSSVASRCTMTPYA